MQIPMPGKRAWLFLVTKGGCHPVKPRKDKKAGYLHDGFSLPTRVDNWKHCERFQKDGSAIIPDHSNFEDPEQGEEGLVIGWFGSWSILDTSPYSLAGYHEYPSGKNMARGHMRRHITRGPSQLGGKTDD